MSITKDHIRSALQKLWVAHDRLSLRIEVERKLAWANPLPMAFVTFETSRQSHCGSSFLYVSLIYPLR